MKKYQIEIIGIAPLRMNKFTDEAKKTLSGGGVKLSEDEYKQDAFSRTYTNEKGLYVIPKNAIKACLANGATKVKSGRYTSGKIIKAIAFISGTKDPLLKSGKPVVTVETVRIPPKTGARVLKYFCVFEEWSCDFVLEIWDDRVKKNVPLESLREAGIYYGLLDGRPEYGRFIVNKFEEIIEK